MRNGTTTSPPPPTDNSRIDLSSNDPEQAIAEALGDQPRAAYWRELREVLADRLKEAKVERDALPAEHPERTIVEKRVAELRQQVHALATEEAVTQFLEDTIRASLTRPVRPGSFVFDEFDEFEE